MIQDKNLILNQMIGATPIFSIHELTPEHSNELEDVKYLTFGDEINWSSIKGSNSIILTQDSSGDLTIDTSIDAFSGTEMYFSDGQIGIGRYPLFNYKVDIGVPENTRMTAMHIGDGTFGFSLGNATDTGFLPQIIGIGSDEDDAGLYFLGKTTVDISSNIPLLVFDGRDASNNALANRPIMGISSGSYTQYKFLIDQIGNVEIDGNINAKNITILDASDNIQDLRQEIEDLKARLLILEQP
jgi:hypothetical protein